MAALSLSYENPRSAFDWPSGLVSRRSEYDVLLQSENGQLLRCDE
jgi:hypothetical protein